MGWRTVVRGGCRWRATGTSSKPVTATVSGILIPLRARACITPSAVWSLAQTIARGSLRGVSTSPVTTRKPPAQACDAAGRKHAVVQDQAVDLARHRLDAARHVLIGEPNRADEHVEAAPLGGHVDAAVDDVHEQKALVLVLEARFVTSPEDDADHLFQPIGEGAGGAVGDEAELGHRLHHAFAGAGPRAALAVEHAGDR